MEREEYLLSWGVNFVENFHFEDQKRKSANKKKKIKIGRNQENNNQINRLNRVATVTKSSLTPDKEIGKVETEVEVEGVEGVEEGVEEKKEGVEEVEAGVEEKKEEVEEVEEKKEEVEEEVEEKKEAKTGKVEDIMDPEVKEILPDSEQGFRKNISSNTSYSTKTETNIKKENRQKLMNRLKHERHQLEKRKRKKMTNQEREQMLIDRENKFSVQLKGFPHFKQYLQNMNMNMNNTQRRQNITHTEEDPNAGYMGNYMFLNPDQNEEHKNCGYIYLNDETKISNNHFQQFRAGKYRKPKKITEICLKIEKMLEEKKEKEERKKKKEEAARKEKEGQSKEETLFTVKTEHIHFKGGWNARNNVPKLEGKPWDFFVVTMEDQKGKWECGDIIYLNEENKWIKATIEVG